MEKRKHDCPICPAFGVYCPHTPNKDDYKLPENELQYLIDKECGLYDCRKTVDLLVDLVNKKEGGNVC